MTEPMQPPENPDVQKSPSPARERVLRHLRKLAKTAAAGAASLSSACIVCDPLPQPVDCSCLSDQCTNPSFWWEAEWTSVETRTIAVRLGSIAENLRFTGPAVLQGAQVGESTNSLWDVEFTCSPLEGVTTITGTVPIMCDGNPKTLSISLDVSGTPQVGKPVPIRIAG